MMRGIVFMS